MGTLAPFKSHEKSTVESLSLGIRKVGGTWWVGGVHPAKWGDGPRATQESTPQTPIATEEKEQEQIDKRLDFDTKKSSFLFFVGREVLRWLSCQMPQLHSSSNVAVEVHLQPDILSEFFDHRNSRKNKRIHHGVQPGRLCSVCYEHHQKQDDDRQPNLCGIF